MRKRGREGSERREGENQGDDTCGPSPTSCSAPKVPKTRCKVMPSMSPRVSQKLFLTLLPSFPFPLASPPLSLLLLPTPPLPLPLYFSFLLFPSSYLVLFLPLLHSLFPLPVPTKLHPSFFSPFSVFPSANSQSSLPPFNPFFPPLKAPKHPVFCLPTLT